MIFFLLWKKSWDTIVVKNKKIIIYSLSPLVKTYAEAGESRLVIFLKFFWLFKNEMRKEEHDSEEMNLWDKSSDLLVSSFFLFQFEIRKPLFRMHEMCIFKQVCFISWKRLFG
jgi:hypothetical protein